jgi:signal transduction histidine kinase
MNAKTEKLARILVVEDEKIIAMAIQACLEDFGYEIVGMVGNGQDAAKIAESTRPDLVLMDIHLQGNQNGIEVAKEIYERFNIPVVYLTAYSDKATLQSVKGSESFGYLLKPFVERELYATLEIAIQRYRSFLKEKSARTHAEKMSRMRDELIAMVSHDLKNPLTGIIIGTDLIKNERWVDSRGEPILDMIQKSCEKMNRMIQGLLDAHKIEAGYINIQEGLGTYTVQSIVQEAFETQQILANEKNVHLEACLPDDLPMVSANMERIQQVFQNLIGNAIKFTPYAGLIQIKAEEAGSNIILSIKDNGPGVEPDLLSHIFERFSQARRTAKTGTGLGLSIAKAIVEAHDGKIWVESKVGIGSTFFFTLPVVEDL